MLEKMAAAVARRGKSLLSLASSSSWRCQPVAAPAVLRCRSYCNKAIPKPPVDGAPRQYPEKIKKIADDIASLSLLETADLTELLKDKLGIQDVPMMAAAPAATPAAALEEEEPKNVPTEFTVKLVGFKEASKIKLIKEIKAQIEGLNLVQARKYIEGIPTVLKEGVTKEAAEKLRTAIEAAGGECELEAS